MTPPISLRTRCPAPRPHPAIQQPPPAIARSATGGRDAAPSGSYNQQHLVLRSYDWGWILSGQPTRREESTLDHPRDPTYYGRLEQALQAALDRRLRTSGTTSPAELLAELRSFRTEVLSTVTA